MNIFYIDESPQQCAKWMCDKHVTKMIVETAQMLSTAHRVCDGEMIQSKVMSKKTGKLRNKKLYIHPTLDGVLYKATHINHPSAAWIRSDIRNYNWAYLHFEALCMEFIHRFDKIHLTQTKLIEVLKNPPNNIRNDEFYQPPACMDKQYIIANDSITNYRNYYKFGKKHLHKWTKREVPYFIGE